MGFIIKYINLRKFLKSFLFSINVTPIVNFPIKSELDYLLFCVHKAEF